MSTLLKGAAVLSLSLGLAFGADKVPTEAAMKAANAALANAPIVKARVVSAPRPMPKGVLPYTGLEVTSVTTSFQVSGLPTFLAAGTGFDYDVALPLASMSQGDAAAVSITWVSDTYTGACAGAFAIVPVAGGSPIAAGAGSPTSCQPGYIYAIGFPVTLPAAPGDYIVVGLAKGNGNGDKYFSFLHIN